MHPYVLSLTLGMHFVWLPEKFSLYTCHNVLPFFFYLPSVLGKRLGKSMGIVAKEVKAMSQESILAFESAGEVVIANQCLKRSDIKVLFVNSLYLSSLFTKIDNQIVCDLSLLRECLVDLYECLALLGGNLMYHNHLLL